MTTFPRLRDRDRKTDSKWMQVHVLPGSGLRSGQTSDKASSASPSFKSIHHTLRFLLQLAGALAGAITALIQEHTIVVISKIMLIPVPLR
ncbi:hypothetical protein BDV19DRAFT_362422 [Aspergillus venezuelensis]